MFLVNGREARVSAICTHVDLGIRRKVELFRETIGMEAMILYTEQFVER